MTIGKTVAVGAAAGGGAGYAWARKQGQTGREAAMTAAKGVAAGGVGGLAVGAGLARRRSGGESPGRAAAAIAAVKGIAEAAEELMDDMRDAAAPVLERVGEAVEEATADVRQAARELLGRGRGGAGVRGGEIGRASCRERV